ncbi:MAG: sporulation protein YabP [Clostridia bacterium]|nr:sporulation protein YabP [Clostridia bacterium]
MEDRRIEGISHDIVIKDRKVLSATGIEDVESFDDDKIVAYTTEGQITVKGAELRINRLTVDSGELEIEGIIDSVEYQDTHRSEGGGIWGKIFR